jgi:hypothetical protein
VINMAFRNCAKINLLIIILIFFLIVIWLLVQPRLENLENLEEKINREIHKANYCTTDGDCVILQGSCPFGCGVYVNKTEIEDLRQQMIDYHQKMEARNLARCVYNCNQVVSPICSSGKCLPKKCEMNMRY